MENITSTFIIPSIIVDENLLKDISKILENEKLERESQHKNSLEERKKLKDEKTGIDFTSAFLALNNPNINLYYKLKSNDGKIRTYNSIEELLEKTHVYGSILWMEMAVNHNNSNYISIKIKMAKTKFSLPTCEITGSDEGKIHEIETDLKGRFESRKTGYSWIHDKSFEKKLFIAEFILSIPLSFSISYYPTISLTGFLSMMAIFIAMITFILFVLADLAFVNKIKSIHPYFYFKLGNNPKKPSNLFKHLNKIFIGVITALIVAAIVKLLNIALSNIVI